MADDSMPRFRYTATLAEEIELRWQDRWEAERTFEAPNPAGPMAEPDKVAGRPKLFVLDMFPYPSGSGLHVGHPLGYIGTDVFARYKRMSGYNVLALAGLRRVRAAGRAARRADRACIRGSTPRTTSPTCGASCAASASATTCGRSISTTDVGYYRWTQWIFLQIFNSWYDRRARQAPAPSPSSSPQFESGARPTDDGDPGRS